MQRQSETNPSCSSAVVAAEPRVSLHELLNAQPQGAAARPQGLAGSPSLPSVVLGRFVGLEVNGTPLVDFEGNLAGRALPARSTAPLDAATAGSEVALLFEGGDLARPIIIGAIQRPSADSRPASPAAASAIKVEATADGERVTISANQEVELRCGKASITLTRAGKVLIRGAYLLSRSSGVNRIKGGSVQIN
ncbi:MAG: DUF6484 domain-containing protein [Thermoguttaceae bacterium]